MNSSLIRVICRFLIASLLVLPFQGAQAGMIGADRIAASSNAQSERAALRDLMTRSDVASQLQSMGVSQSSALERVAAMTDSEVHSVAGQVDSLPAGARNNNGWGLLLLIVIGVVIWQVWK
jgi:hypothetical protein